MGNLEITSEQIVVKSDDFRNKSNENIFVSIVMPAYNAEKFIALTIESVLSQTYLNWELIIVDDCSKDLTRSVINSLAMKDQRIKLIALEKNFGAPAGPRNIGIRQAKGEWIAFLDADDIWHPRKLEIQLALMNQYHAVFSSTLSRNFINENKIIYESIKDYPTVNKITYAMQRLKGRIANSSVVVKKELLLKYPFNEDSRYKAVEDYHCWLNIHKEIAYSLKIQSFLMNYRVVQGQISGSKLYMIKAMFMLHRNFPDTTLIQAVFYTLSHIVGGVMNRLFKNGL